MRIKIPIPTTKITLSRLLLRGMLIASLLWTTEDSARALPHKEQQAGAALFQEKGCWRCHGENGEGTAKAPALSSIGKKWKKSQIEHQILEGGHEMPPFKGALLPSEVKSLVVYLSAKRGSTRSL